MLIYQLQLFGGCAIALLLWYFRGREGIVSSGGWGLIAAGVLVAVFIALSTRTGLAAGNSQYFGIFGGIASLLIYAAILRHGGARTLAMYHLLFAGIGLFWYFTWWGPAGHRMAQMGDAEWAAVDVKAAVNEYFRRTGKPPLSRAEAGLPADPGYDKSVYIDSVDIVQGSVIVTFSDRAATPLARKSLTMTPYEHDHMKQYLERDPRRVWSEDRQRFSVTWKCGNASPSAETEDLMGTAAGLPAVRLTTTVPEQYLPSICRHHE